MARSICASCKLPLGEDCTSWKGKKYHEACLNIMKQAARAKDATKASKLSDPALIELTAYLCDKFQLESLTPYLRKQIKDFKSDNISYEDMLLALRYFYDYQNKNPSDIQSIGIIPYVLTQAKEFFRIATEANIYNSQHSIQNDEVIVHIDPNKWSNGLHYKLEDL